MRRHTMGLAAVLVATTLGCGPDDPDDPWSEEHTQQEVSAGTKILASEDAFVDASEPGTVQTDRLHVQRPGRRTYLRFDLRQVPGGITSAVLRMRTQASNGSGRHTVSFVSSDAWRESTLTYENAPAVGAALAEAAYTSDRYVWRSWNVTARAEAERTADGFLSVAITSSSSSWHRYYSSENAGSEPHLVVVYGSACTQTSCPPVGGDPAPSTPPDPAVGITDSPSKSDPPGTSYASQKQVFADAVSGRTVWRMTVDGVQGGAINNLRDTSGMEANSWSADGRRICFSKSGHSRKPDGIYVMDVSTGVETFMAATGSRWGTCEFSRSSNELFFTTGYTASTIASSYLDLRAIDLTTRSVRTIKRFGNALGNSSGLSQNGDGSLIATRVSVNTPGASHTTNQVHVVILTPRGEVLPMWEFDPAGVPDMTGAGDHPYWSPTDRRVVRTFRDGRHRMWNVDTLAIQPNPAIVGIASLGSSHSCITVDGSTMLHINGHPDCHPGDRALGDRTRVVADGGGHLYLTEMRNAAGLIGPDKVFPPSSDILAVQYYRPVSSNFTHPHPHFSRDGRYVLFISPVNTSSLGTPPGGVDTDPSTVSTDVFIVPLEAP